MVKLDDNRFAVMYSIANDKTGKSVLHYTVVDNAGEKVLGKTYKNMTFTGTSQPVLANGNIYWIDQTLKGKAYLHRIPAL